MKLAVIGAGVTGLTAAHRAREIAAERGISLDLTLLEARGHLGGTILSERTDGFLIEAGPDSFISEKPWALHLVRRLGIERDLLRTDDRFRQTFVWRGNRLHALPDGFQLLAPTRVTPFLMSSLFSWPGKLRMALDLVLPRGGHADESLGRFVRRRLGREALERVAQPLVAGIYTADPETLSLAATMPRFLELERRERSIILGLWRASRRLDVTRAESTGTSGARWSLFVTLRHGMGQLTDTLAARLPVGSIHVKQDVALIERCGERWRLSTRAGLAVEADAVIVATEAHVAARLLDTVDARLASELRSIPYASSATVSLAYRRDDIPHALDGFGFVVPRTERRDVLACTFSSVKYAGRAPAGHALLRCFLGGAGRDAVLENNDEMLEHLAREDMRRALGITSPPLLTRVWRHPASMPQYHVGHLGRLEALDRRLDALPGVALAGGGYRGVGISDCVRSGEAAAELLLTRAPIAS